MLFFLSLPPHHLRFKTSTLRKFLSFPNLLEYAVTLFIVISAISYTLNRFLRFSLFLICICSLCFWLSISCSTLLPCHYCSWKVLAIQHSSTMFYDGVLAYYFNLSMALQKKLLVYKPKKGEQSCYLTSRLSMTLVSSFLLV